MRAPLQVIGVVRGRSEHGPRALGHRSLLSAPSKGMKERMNALKVSIGSCFVLLDLSRLLAAGGLSLDFHATLIWASGCLA